MTPTRIGGLGAAIVLALGLGACTDGYGYSGLAVGYNGGYGDGYYGDPYYDAGYGGGYGAYGGYAPSYFGWYGDYYYPGTGVYVFDSNRRPYRWNNAQQRYWSQQQRYRGRDWNGQGSWNGFDRRNGRTDGWRGDGGGNQWQGRGRPDSDRARGNRRGGDRSGDGNGYAAGTPGQVTPGAQGYRGGRGERGTSAGEYYRNTPGTRSEGYRGDRTSAPPQPRSERQSGGRTSVTERQGRGAGGQVREQ
ncbi:hypothetical protein [Sphingomonas sp.]|jgi:hypothetical protein|uniref:hypothetical protein n=1 Tax=Sphingomonas sp. TaxID=28214 RepID=UPI002ED90771